MIEKAQFLISSTFDFAVQKNVGQVHVSAWHGFPLKVIGFFDSASSEEDNRPQVREDVDYENGMGISVGRLREDTVYDYKFVGLSHNTVRGAAGGAVLCAETLKAKGYITKK